MPNPVYAADAAQPLAQHGVVLVQDNRAPQLAARPENSAARSSDPVVNAILHSLPTSAVEAGRDSCTTIGTHDPAYVLKHYGWPGDEYNGEHCIANLQRLANDGRLLNFYTKFGVTNADDAWKLVNKVSDLARQYPTGNFGVGMKDGRVIAVPPGLALDAGFTRAYVEGNQSQQVDPIPDNILRNVASKCTQEQMRRDVCEATGYRIGQQVYRSGASSVLSMR